MTALITCRQLTLAAFLLLAPLGAQTAAANANRFIPADSMMVLRVASPAKWREQMATTQVAKLMQSNTLAPLLQQAEMGWQMMLGEARDSGKFDVDLLESLADDWQGDMIWSLRMDIGELIEAMQVGDPPPFSGTMVLTAGGSFDVAKFAAEVLRTADEQGELHDLVVGDHTFRVGEANGQKLSVALGPVIDGAMVVLFGNDLDVQAEKLLAKEDRFAGDIGKGPLFAHLELASMMKGIADAAGMQAPPEGAEMIETMFAALGINALRSLTVAIDADGKDLIGEIELALGGSDPGIFGVLSGGTSTPRLLRSVPPSAEAFSVMPLQLAKLYDVAEDIWGSLGDQVPMSFDDALQMFEEATKVRLKEDLLDHLGDSLLNIQDVEVMKSLDLAEDEDDPMAMINGNVYGIALKNGAAFGESLEKLVRARGMHAGRKTEDYGSAKVHRLKLAGLIDLEYVVTDDLLLVGAGEAGSRMIRSVLDAHDADEAELPAAAKQHVADLPAGWNGLGITPLAPMLQMIGNALATADDPDLEMAQMICSGLAEDLKRLGIASMTSAMYFDAKGLKSRMRW